MRVSLLNAMCMSACERERGGQPESSEKKNRAKRPKKEKKEKKLTRFLFRTLSVYNK